MNMETPIEYYYGDTLRWSFGFDNPNKAAVIFACALPLLWWLWRMAWRIGNVWLRIPALVVSAGLLAGAWYCLIMTFSRGGLVAATMALAYLIGRAMWVGRKQAGRWHKSAVVWCSVLVIAGLLGAAVWNGLDSRSAEALGNDASVGNRIELWGSALQMAAENPRGFGTEKSGEQYMQWYQPLDREQGYRTMVNSYLTFLVEQGWFWTIAVLAGFAVFWVWTKPAGDESFAPALHASILAFLVAAVFSTTMEEWRLWILPAAACVLLVGNAIWKKRSIERRRLAVVGGIGFAGCVALLGTGLVKSHSDPLRRDFGEIGGFRTVTSVAPKGAKTPSLGCVVDEAIVGDQYARRLRELALGAGVRIVLGDGARQVERMLFMGSGVHSCASYPVGRLLLLAPESVLDEEIAALAARNGPVTIMLPEIDEDGRVGFWEDVTEGARAERFQTSALSGVGNRVDWAWDEVIELVKGG